jgi:putative membrane protein
MEIMLKWMVLRLLVTAVAFAVTAWLLPPFDIEGGVPGTLWVAVIFGVVNAVIGPILHLVALPFTILTLGLFALVVNGVVLAIVAGLTDHLQTGGFGWAVLGALIVTVVSAALNHFLEGATGRPARRDRLTD